VTPGTLLRWHQGLARWRWTHRHWAGLPPAGAMLVALITQMPRQNPAGATGGSRANCSAWASAPAPRGAGAEMPTLPSAAEGKTKKEIIRCLKRYIARKIYKALCRPQQSGRGTSAASQTRSFGSALDMGALSAIRVLSADRAEPPTVIRSQARFRCGSPNICSPVRMRRMMRQSSDEPVMSIPVSSSPSLA